MEQKTKKCTSCLEVKTIDSFHKQAGGLHGVQSNCKICESTRNSEYAHSVEGVFSGIYKTQVKASKTRGHIPPEYTKQELIDKYSNTELFTNLYTAWVESGYLKGLRPSFDRKNDDLGYSFDNIMLTTWSKNYRKANRDQKSGKLRSNHKVVYQYTLDGKYLKDFTSIAYASRSTGVPKSSISNCCSGKYETAGGFKWKLK